MLLSMADIRLISGIIVAVVIWVLGAFLTDWLLHRKYDDDDQ